MNRKMVVLLLCAVCLLFLASCGEREQEETEWSEVQMAQAIWDSQPGLDGRALLYGEPDFDGYIADAYQISPSDVAGGAVLYAGGVYAQEIAVLRLNTNADVHAAVNALQDYISVREGAFVGYAPEQYAILERSTVAERGRFAVLLICPDQNAAQDAFAACFTTPPPQSPAVREDDAAVMNPEPFPEPELESEPKPEPQPEPESEPNPEQEPELGPESELKPEPRPESGPESEPKPEQEPESEPGQEPEPESEPDPVIEPEFELEPEADLSWSYDASRITGAWFSGTWEGLWAEDIEILSVLDQIPALANTTLSDYDRELALHDWMVEWGEYDPGALSSGPIGNPLPHNDDPYGFLVGRKGICLGYSTTFQLLMDLSGIECLTVHGTAHAGSDEHAWNLVRLDGEWYAVDVTWDDPVSTYPVPVSSPTAHRYFNVTSDFLRETDHQWDDGAVPEAEGTAFPWAG